MEISMFLYLTALGPEMQGKTLALAHAYPAPPPKLTYTGAPLRGADSSV